MNVLFITHYSDLYGANRSLLALLDGIKRERITPFVLLPKTGDLEGELKIRNIPYFKFPFKNWMAQSRLKIPLRLFLNLAAIPALLWKFRHIKLDVIYTNSSVIPVGAWLAYFLGLPHIWHVREFGWEDYRIKYDLGRKQFEYWMNRADHIVAISESVQKKVLNNITTPSSIVYNGVLSKEKAETLNVSTSGSVKNKSIFGILGKLSPEKGQEQAIKAFGHISDSYPFAELWIAGSGIDKFEKYLKRVCDELKLSDKVKFLGFVNDPFKFYSQIDIALVCSRYEGMGRVTAEAMIAGKVIIGLDNAGTSELLKDGKTGLLYDGSIESLASKMKLAITNDMSSIAQNARKSGLDHYLIENYAMKIENIIQHSHLKNHTE